MRTNSLPMSQTTSKSLMTSLELLFCLRWVIETILPGYVPGCGSSPPPPDSTSSTSYLTAGIYLLPLWLGRPPARNVLVAPRRPVIVADGRREGLLPGRTARPLLIAAHTSGSVGLMDCPVGKTDCAPFLNWFLA